MRLLFLVADGEESLTMKSTDWQGPFNTRLIAVASDEYKAQKVSHLKRRRSLKTFRYVPPQWQIDAIQAMVRNDEELAKACLLYR